MVRAQSAPPILLSLRRGAFVRAVLRDLMHLVHRHEHAVRAGILQIEIIAGRAEDRLGAQPEVLPDAVDGVHDVIADAQVGQRDRHAFLDRAQLDAFGRLTEDLAVAEHVQPQAGDREARFERTRVDEHRAARGGPPTATPSVPAARRCTKRALRSTVMSAARRISVRRDAPLTTSSTVSPAAVQSRTASRTRSIWRLNNSPGRVSSACPSTARGSHGTSSRSMPPVTISVRRAASVSR